MAMFSKTGKAALDTQQIATLISEGCIVEGNIKAPAFIRIDGQINGNVTVDGGLILGEKGLITGDVVTKDMIVYGKVIGNLEVYGLEIKASGRVVGEIKTKTLIVEHGAVYNGKLLMAADEQPGPDEKSKKSA